MPFTFFVLICQFQLIYSERTPIDQTTWSQIDGQVQICLPLRKPLRDDLLQVVYSERTLRLTDFETTTYTTWSRSTDGGIPTRGWSFTNLRRSPSTSEIATRGPNRRTDRRQNRCTTWSRSTGLPGKGWSLRSTSRLRRTKWSQKILQGLPSKGWSLPINIETLRSIPTRVKEPHRRRNSKTRGPDQHSLRHPRKVEASIDVETTTCTTWFQLTAEASHKVEASVDVF